MTIQNSQGFCPFVPTKQRVLLVGCPHAAKEGPKFQKVRNGTELRLWHHIQRHRSSAVAYKCIYIYIVRYYSVINIYNIIYIYNIISYDCA